MHGPSSASCCFRRSILRSIGVFFISDIIIVISDSVKHFLPKSRTFLIFFPQPRRLPPCRRHRRYNSAMPMTPFMKRFPELGARKTRSVTVPDNEDLPSGEYGFIELYCNEPNCDCRHVDMVSCSRPETGWKFWAVINYGLGKCEVLQAMGRSSRLGSLRMAGARSLIP